MSYQLYCFNLFYNYALGFDVLLQNCWHNDINFNCDSLNCNEEGNDCDCGCGCGCGYCYDCMALILILSVLYIMVGIFGNVHSVIIQILPRYGQHNTFKLVQTIKIKYEYSTHLL